MNASSPWQSRGYLPHYDDGTRVQLITYRLADSLPAEAITRLRGRLTDERERRIALQNLLDAGYGTCVLREAENASIVASAWQFFHGTRYRLHAWVIMPNHVHVLLETIAPHTLKSILHSQKSFTAKRILQRMPPPAATGPGGAVVRLRFWEPDYYDRFVRDERHYDSAVRYIHMNPVTAGLVTAPGDWGWSSAAWPHWQVPGYYRDRAACRPGGAQPVVTNEGRSDFAPRPARNNT